MGVGDGLVFVVVTVARVEEGEGEGWTHLPRQFSPRVHVGSLGLQYWSFGQAAILKPQLRAGSDDAAAAVDAPRRRERRVTVWWRCILECWWWWWWS